MKKILDLLEHQRKKLLDTSLRNRLLNYKLTNYSIEIEYEWPQDIFVLLVYIQKSFILLPKIEDESEQTLDELYQRYLDDLSDEDENGFDNFEDEEWQSSEFRTNDYYPRLVPNNEKEEPNSRLATIKSTLYESYKRLIGLGKLPTNHDGDDLKKRVKNIHRDIKYFNKEFGINPYYIALGMLEWADPNQQQNQKLYSAPIFLIPVTITQKHRWANYEVQYTDKEVEINETLYEKLLMDFGLQLPSPPKNFIVSKIQEFFTQIESSVKRHGWVVHRHKIVLTRFKSSTFLMHRDLKVESWKEESNLENNSTLSTLMYGRSRRSQRVSFKDKHFIDSEMDPNDYFQIHDADSSQLMAICQVKNGNDLIIQGPPGTGKSQTITNIIAQAIGDEKTVLFVAQKDTALKVVKDKLAEASLDQLCLELYGLKTKRSDFLREIQKTLENAKDTETQRLLGDPKELSATRDYLNNYCRVVNTPIKKGFITPFQCFEKLLYLENILEEARPPIWPDQDLFERDNMPEYYEWLPKIENLQLLISEIGMPKDNVFRFCKYDQDAFIVPERIKQIIRQVQTALRNLEEISIELATHLSLAIPATTRKTELLVDLANYIVQSPSLSGVNIRSDKWQKKSKEIQATYQAIMRSEQLKRNYKNILVSGAWTSDISNLKAQVRSNKNPLYYFPGVLDSIPDSFADRLLTVPDDLVGLCIIDAPKAIKEQIAIIDAISSYQNYQKQIDEQEPLFKELLSERLWEERRFDWKYISILTTWLHNFNQKVQVMNASSSIFDYLENGPQIDVLINLCESAKTNLKQYENSVTNLTNFLHLDEEGQFGKGHKFANQSYEEQTQLLNIWISKISQLKDIVDYNRIKEELIQDGFLSIVKIGEVWSEASKYLVDITNYAWYSHLIDQTRRNNSGLMFNRGAMHEKEIHKFCELDKRGIKENRSYLSSMHNENIVNLKKLGESDDASEMKTQLEIIRGQCLSTSRKLSIRKIMGKAGKAVQTIKPIFVMSPSYVADFLPPGKVKFDLVIFDEASQISPENATGAILRGAQTVVVGDSKQLPPSKQFSTSPQFNRFENIPDAESVLDLFSIKGVLETTLLWHYRSQHHSLIAPSNHEFYQNELVVFPSPKIPSKDLGVSFIYISDGIYDRGGSRKNLIEAKTVAEAAISHAKTNRELSLGIVALNKEQTDAIEHHLELLIDQNPICEDFFRNEDLFFITNLENVQGDERAVIFISITHGFSKDGKLRLNFGPITHPGGERRLNVLISRAQKRCVVFSSIRASDIYDRNPSNEGTRILAKYLDYAEKGIIRDYNEMRKALIEEDEDYQKKHERLIKLMSILNEKFDIGELKNLCFQLGIDFDNVRGDRKILKAQDLAMYFHNRENIDQLIQVGERVRPDIKWKELISTQSKDDSGSEENVLKNSKMLQEQNYATEHNYDVQGKTLPKLSKIEEEVTEALHALGYDVKWKVGPTNSAIPIAVIDEEGNAILGIEFDGPNYYQARSARDRDRLRYEQLDRLQWKIHRIWIIDWYYNKEREINRLVQAIEASLAIEKT